MKKNKSVLYAIVAVASLLIGYQGYRLYQHSKAFETTDDAQIDGNLIPINARVGGYIGQIYFHENEAVKAGDLILVIDSSELQAKVNLSKAALDGAKAQLKVSHATASDAKLAYEIAVSSLEIPKTNLWKAQKDYQRYKDLYGQKMASEQQMETYKVAYENAKAQNTIAQKKVQSAKQQMETLHSQVLVAEANVTQKLRDLEYAQLQLNYIHVHAPVSGIISKNNLQPGQLIQPGQPLMSVVQSNETWVTANFKETQLQELSEGNEVSIKVDAYPDLEVKGKVASTSGATGAKFSLIPPDNASGNYVKVVQRIPIRISIDHTEETRAKLKPGMSVFVEVRKNG